MEGTAGEVSAFVPKAVPVPMSHCPRGAARLAPRRPAPRSRPTAALPRRSLAHEKPSLCLVPGFGQQLLQLQTHLG